MQKHTNIGIGDKLKSLIVKTKEHRTPAKNITGLSLPPAAQVIQASTQRGYLDSLTAIKIEERSTHLYPITEKMIK